MEKLLLFFHFYTVYSKKIAVLIATYSSFACGTTKTSGGGKVWFQCCFVRLFSPFPQQFSTHSHKAKRHKMPKASKTAKEKAFEKKRQLLLVLLPDFFHKQKGVAHAVNALHTFPLSLSTVSAGSTNITINYLYHSFVIGAARPRERESAKKGILL